MLPTAARSAKIAQKSLTTSVIAIISAILGRSKSLPQSDNFGSQPRHGPIGLVDMEAVLTIRSIENRCKERGIKPKLCRECASGATGLNFMIRVSSTAKQVSTAISAIQGSPCSPLEVSGQPRVTEIARSTKKSPNRACYGQEGPSPAGEGSVASASAAGGAADREGRCAC